MSPESTLQPDIVCKHGVAMDVHCCNCHSGFLFDASQCVCLGWTISFVNDAGTIVTETYQVAATAEEAITKAERRWGRHVSGLRPIARLNDGLAREKSS